MGVSNVVPQGTVLRPILFIIYINYLLAEVNFNGLLYADDTKIFRSIVTKEDAIKLQGDIDKLERWAKKWLMNFHPQKCHVLTLGKFTNIPFAYRYSVCGQEIEHVFVEKDLGIHIDGELSFEEHICTKVRVANAIVVLIRQSFTHLEGNSFKTLICLVCASPLRVWAEYLGTLLGQAH